MKPVKGGRPPRERKMRGARDVRTGAFVQEVASALMVVALLILKTKNVEKVMTKYVSNARNVKEGAVCNTRIIQPR